MRNTRLHTAILAAACIASSTAFAGEQGDIAVMTQNQYLGANLAPVIAASPDQFNEALVRALAEVANNNFPERAAALADSIHDKQPHLVALQEVYAFSCVDPWLTGLCDQVSGAFNDHLELTLAALGGQYRVAAQVQNLTLPPPGVPVPGIPVELDASGRQVFIRVIDRDVILARADVDTTPVTFPCAKPSVDGCNFQNVAPVSVAGIPINIERGFVGVDATIDGEDYRFIDTHLEVRQLGTNPASAFLQPAQATELWQAILATFDPSRRLIVAGDFNSSPADISPVPVPTAYQQLANGVLINGYPLGFGLTDVWDLRPGNPDGFTCCELADLSNAPSLHTRRIDIVFAYPAPASVKANVLDADVGDKTISGLWPADHASVNAELSY